MGGSAYCGRRKRVDANHKQIAEALRKAGYSVLSLADCGKGVPDLLVSSHDRTFLLEIKRGKNTQTADQIGFVLHWRGEVQLVRTVEDALFVAQLKR